MTKCEVTTCRDTKEGESGCVRRRRMCSRWERRLRKIKHEHVTADASLFLNWLCQEALLPCVSVKEYSS